MLKSFFFNRLDERSTWRGLIMALSALGISLEPAQAEAIIAIGLAVVGLLEAFLPDPSGKIKQ
jgi:hypothetical protein